MNYSNYTTIFEKDVAALQSKAVLLRHKKTGARVFALLNDDDNKVFYIGFRTPPADDTGVAHIMEHSVLCGSKKYPIKDPFVELAKGSLNTFLNAMTYPDKTVYPVASRNKQDFANLMDVYLDAVFHPAIYEHPEILKQEGWNYKIENADDPITYNGVVYNEMKGAFSSPESVLDRAVLHSIYPDTPYGTESGGDPDFIPDLTYENFIAFHQKYYHPSNSFIYLYGDMDIEERLAFLDSAYLSAYDAIEVDSALPKQPAFAALSDVCLQYPISENEEETNNTYLTYNLVCGDNLEPRQYYAMQMIQYALVDNQGAPIRDRLLKEGIGKSIMSSYECGILQPYFNIEAKNANPEQKERFVQIIREELEKAAREGMNPKSLLASLNSLEFKYKEADYGGYPKGLIYGLSALDSWLYDENEPLMHIDCEETFRFLRAQIGSSYYADLVKAYLLDNPHASILSLVPKKGLTAEKDEALRKKLEAYKASLSEEEVARLVEETHALAAFQEEPNSPEALATIPLLTREDIKKEEEPYKNEERSVVKAPVVFHDYFTNGIAYIHLYFDANAIAPEDLSYWALLMSLMSFVDTEKYSYSELNNEVNIHTGGLSFGASTPRSRKDWNKTSLLVDLSIRVLYGNIDTAFDLLEEILFASDYTDTDRLYELVAEMKSRLETNLNFAGHAAAVLRAQSYYSAHGCLHERTSGIDYYRFIVDLEANFAQRKDALVAKLQELAAAIYRPEGLFAGVTAEEAGYEAFANRFAAFVKRLQTETKSNGVYAQANPLRMQAYPYLNDLKPEQKNEGFQTSGSVQYVARTGKFADDAFPIAGALKVFRTIMSYEYLWFHIRVQGGAYGCMSMGSLDGDAAFVTYRDPNLSRSNDVFEGIPEFLESFDADEREMTKYVIGTMSSVDTPLPPASKGTRDMNAYLTQMTYEDMQEIRNATIACTARDIRALAPYIRRALDEGNICVIGNEQKIEEEKELFKTVTHLFS